MTQTEMSYSGCERVHVFLLVVNGLVDPSWDGGENHVEAGLGAETGHHLDHGVWRRGRGEEEEEGEEEERRGEERRGEERRGEERY